MSDPTPTPPVESTSSAIKLAEKTIEGVSRAATFAAANEESPSAIGKAMEYTQPGSTKKRKNTEPLTEEGEVAAKEKKSRKSHKKKGKKEKAGKDSAETPEVVMKVSVKHLEERYDEQGYVHIHEPGVEPPEKSKEDKWADFVLCELRHFNYENKFTHRTLEVKSKHIKETLKKVIGEYPSISFKTHKIKLEFPLRCLYHYLDELKVELEALKNAKTLKKDEKKEKGKKEKGKKEKKDKKKHEEDSEKEKTDEEPDAESKAEVKDEEGKGKEKSEDKPVNEEQKQKQEEEAIEHLEFLIQFLENEFQETIKDFGNLFPHGLITYELLWTIFKPGMIVFAKTNNEQRALKLISTDYVTSGRENFFQLSLEYVDYDGKSFGLAEATIPIYPFQGSKSISSLNSFPLNFHPKETAVREFLIERGRRFEGYQGTHYMEYKGIGLGEVQRCRRVQYNINGRVMLDAATYDRINPDRSITLSALSGKEKEPTRGGYEFDSDYDSDSGTREKCILNTEQPPLTDEQCLLAHFLVSGFALSEKKWVDFYIDNLSPIQWNSNAFDQLVLPASQKSLVKALVESHVKDIDGFDDIIKGKGKGLISILHGPPGVGKTLTAESVAEHTRRPLYAVSSGELGTNPKELEENLARILDVATVWKAVLLLDEADVFLEKRSLHDLIRNSLVSIFLRLLEYYQGILFLTSNRVTSFDEAFQSRIHVALKYNKLDKDARVKVWKNFMKFDETKDGKSLLEAVSERELNGRQIKNCVRTARSLAEAEGNGVQLSHLKMVLDIQEQFEKDFGGLMSNGADE